MKEGGQKQHYEGYADEAFFFDDNEYPQGTKLNILVRPAADVTDDFIDSATEGMLKKMRNSGMAHKRKEVQGRVELHIIAQSDTLVEGFKRLIQSRSKI